MALPKSRINLKYKDIDGGRKSIYLDYYKDGKRIRESLRLYLLPETSRKAAAGNKAVMRKAEEVRRSRIEELTAGENGIEIDAAMSDIQCAKLLQKSEMRKDIVIELSYRGFSRASDYS